MPINLRLNTLLVFSLLIVISASTGCAGLYRPVEVENHNTFSRAKGDSLSYKYDLDIMMEAKNKRYARKASRVGVELILLEIHNLTNDTLPVSGLTYTLDKTQYEPMDAVQVKNSVRQIPLGYLAYSLVFPGWAYNLPVGFPITLANIIVAINSNHKFRKNLYRHYIKEKKIPPGQKIRGFLGFYTTNDVYRPDKMQIIIPEESK